MPGHQVVSLNTVESIQKIILTLIISLECPAKGMLSKLKTKMLKKQGGKSLKVSLPTTSALILASTYVNNKTIYSSPMMNPFNLLLRSARVSGKRKQTSKNHMMVLRLLSSQHWTISIPSCRKPKEPQHKLRRRTPENAQEDMMASPKEPRSVTRSAERTLQSRVTSQCLTLWNT